VINKPILEGHGRAEYVAKDKDEKAKKLAFISPKGKPAITAYRVIAARPAATLLECRAVTGRLHQLRVHLEAIGCPILGDELYARPAVKAAAPRLALHAHRVACDHPITGELLDVGSAWPSDLRGLLRRHKLPRPDIPEGVAPGEDSSP
jgi:23S rRNA pseudouridine1911/1915/1917 synthase